MIHELYHHQLSEVPSIARQMFRDRAAQFAERLGWDVTVDRDGQERDEYDALDPLYLIVTRARRHAGSLRFLPTTGRTMVNEHFTDILGGGRIESPVIWECTRLCLAPGAGRDVSAELLAAALRLGLRSGLSDAVGVFDTRMLRVYGRLGWPPTMLGEKDGIAVGLWAFDAAILTRLTARAGLVPQPA